MRHGHALAGASADAQRPLSQQGKLEAAAIAHCLLQKNVMIDIFYQSTKKRAQETALIVRDILNPQARIETKDGLAPDDPLEHVLNEIPCWKENTMIVSHMPFLPRLISRLITGREDNKMVAMPTASVAVMQHLGQKWTLLEIISPKDI